jgi:ankyrin repeat protein
MPVRLIRGGIIAVFLSSAVVSAETGASFPDAVKAGDTAAIRQLLERRADVNAIMPDGTSALHWAVRSGDLETAQLLIRAGANAKVADRHGVTPLSLACLNGNAVMIRALLDAGAPADSTDGQGEPALITASRTGNIEGVKLLLDRGAPVNVWDTHAGQTALMWAIREHHSDVVKLLLSRGADAKATTKVVSDFPPETGNLQGVGRAQNLPKGVTPGGMTPLIYAAREGTLDVVQMLLDAGVDVNAAEANQTTPLLIAILNDHIDVATFLLEHGANLNAADGFGRTALWAAVDMRNLDTPDNTETDRGPMLELIRVLLDHGADTNASLKAEPPSRRWMFGFGVNQWVSQVGQTPLQRAALAGDIASVRLLLAKGTDPNIKSHAGVTPLMAAAGLGWVLNQTYTESTESILEIVKLCVEKGVDVNAATSTGVTAMHAAANRGLNPVIEFVAQHGAKLDVKDSQGRTPATYAEGVRLSGPPEPKPQTVALLHKLAAQ